MKTFIIRCYEGDLRVEPYDAEPTDTVQTISNKVSNIVSGFYVNRSDAEEEAFIRQEVKNKGACDCLYQDCYEEEDDCEGCGFPEDSCYC